MQFTGEGGKIFQGITAKEAQRGLQQYGSPGRAIRRSSPALRDRPRQRDQVVPARSTSTRPGRHLRRRRRDHRAWPASSEAKDLALVLQTGALPVQFEHARRSTDVSATLGKDSLDQAKLAAGDRPARRRALPAPLLSLPRRRRGHRPRDLRGLPLRGDPGLQRHADAAGLRGDDPHDRRRRRRERGHLRTDQGRSTVREVRPARDRHGLLARASTRSSTRTSSPRSRRSSCSRSPPPRSRASRSCC